MHWGICNHGYKSWFGVSQVLGQVFRNCWRLRGCNGASSYRPRGGCELQDLGMGWKASVWVGVGNLWLPADIGRRWAKWKAESRRERPELGDGPFVSISGSFLPSNCPYHCSQPNAHLSHPTLIFQAVQLLFWLSCQTNCFSYLFTHRKCPYIFLV